MQQQNSCIQQKRYMQQKIHVHNKKYMYAMEYIYGQKNTSLCEKNIQATIYSTIYIYSYSTCASYILVRYIYC